MESVGKGGTLGAAVSPPFVDVVRRGPRGARPRPGSLALAALGPFAVCRAHSRPLSCPARALCCPRSGSFGLRLRLAAHRSLAKARSLPCLSGAARPVARGPAAPRAPSLRRVAAAPRRLGPRFGWLPVWLRPCLARPPCVGAVSLGLRPCCPRVAAARVRGSPPARRGLPLRRDMV